MVPCGCSPRPTERVVRDKNDLKKWPTTVLCIIFKISLCLYWSKKSIKKYVRLLWLGENPFQFAITLQTVLSLFSRCVLPLAQLLMWTTEEILVPLTERHENACEFRPWEAQGQEESGQNSPYASCEGTMFEDETSLPPLISTSVRSPVQCSERW